MKGSIVFQNKKGGEISFRITNEHLWERLYHEVAFLAESGRGVSYWICRRNCLHKKAVESYRKVR